MAFYPIDHHTTIHVLVNCRSWIRATEKDPVWRSTSDRAVMAQSRSKSCPGGSDYRTRKRPYSG